MSVVRLEPASSSLTTATHSGARTALDPLLATFAALFARLAGERQLKIGAQGGCPTTARWNMSGDCRGGSTGVLPGPAQIVRLGHRGTPSIDVSDEIAILAARPIASLPWREMDSNYWYRGTKAVDFRGIPGIPGYRRARKRYHLMVQPLFFCALSHSIEPGWARFEQVVACCAARLLRPAWRYHS